MSLYFGEISPYFSGKTVTCGEDTKSDKSLRGIVISVLRECAPPIFAEFRKTRAKTGRKITKNRLMQAGVENGPPLFTGVPVSVETVRTVVVLQLKCFLSSVTLPGAARHARLLKFGHALFGTPLFPPMPPLPRRESHFEKKSPKLTRYRVAWVPRGAQFFAAQFPQRLCFSTL